MADENENVAAEDRSQDAVGGEKTASNLPFIITLLALTLYFGFQTLQLASDRSNLTAVKSNQEAAMQEAQKVQVQFKTLVTKTSQLADQGHAGARMVMEELQKRGIGFAPEAKAPETKMPETKAPAKAETKSAK
jgi:regulatory protein YycI of two-component signal transduction system YycFG